MPQFGFLDYLLWACGFLLRCYLLTQVPRQKFLPLYVYILGFIVRDFLLLPVILFGTSAQYYYLYWATAFLMGAVNLWNGIFVYRRASVWLSQSEHKLFRFLLDSLIAFSVLAVIIAPIKGQIIPHFIQSLDRSASILLIGVYFGVFSLDAVFHISIRPRLRDVAAGFAIYKSVDVMRGAIHVHFGFVPYMAQIGFILALIWWIAAFRKPEPELLTPKSGELERLKTIVEGFAERNTPDLVAGKRAYVGGE